MIALPLLSALLPLLGGLGGAISPRPRLAGSLLVLGATGSVVTTVWAAVLAAGGTVIAIPGGFIYVDSLSAFFAVTVALVLLLSSLGSFGYVRTERERGHLTNRQVRFYFILFSLFGASMLGAVETANLGLLFVLVEASTLTSVVLVAIEGRTSALEAGWRYVIISSLGITIALVGTLFIFYAASGLPGSPEAHLAWAFLIRHARGLQSAGLRLGFLLAVVGYGTKVGLAPMHTWLPDAHAEAPSPASAMLSGALLNVGMYAIIRFVGIADRGLGSAYAGRTMLAFGFLSVLVGMIFMVRCRDYKRLLAFSSIEQMGIIAIGLGFGGVLGIYGALLQTLNHALGKTVLFLTTGGLLLSYRSRNTAAVTGLISTFPLLGGVLLLASLALLGSPPFGLFLSEFTIVRAGLSQAQPGLVALLLLFLAIAFIAFIQVISGMVFGEPEGKPVAPYSGRLARWSAYLPLLLGLVGLLVLGLWVPGLLNGLLTRSVGLVR